MFVFCKTILTCRTICTMILVSIIKCSHVKARHLVKVSEKCWSTSKQKDFSWTKVIALPDHGWDCGWEAQSVWRSTCHPPQPPPGHSAAINRCSLSNLTTIYLGLGMVEIKCVTCYTKASVEWTDQFSKTARQVFLLPHTDGWHWRQFYLLGFGYQLPKCVIPLIYNGIPWCWWNIWQKQLILFSNAMLATWLFTDLTVNSNLRDYFISIK